MAASDPLEIERESEPLDDYVARLEEELRRSDQ
jgi:hypothetical protein